MWVETHIQDFFALHCDSTIIPSEQLLSIVVKAAAQKQSTNFRQIQFYLKWLNYCGSLAETQIGNCSIIVAMISKSKKVQVIKNAAKKKSWHMYWRTSFQTLFACFPCFRKQTKLKEETNKHKTSIFFMHVIA